jgi:hypothetical protein
MIMKKEYQKPQATAIAVEPNGILCVSFGGEGFIGGGA